jgi:GntR family transcriptional regulator / MocR family aminotransferase
MSPWDLKISIKVDRTVATSVYKQLERQIIEEIVRGRLAPGAALPGTRELAAQLDVNRKTVVLAYEELAAQGWVLSHPTRGTFVSDAPPNVRKQTPATVQSRPPACPQYGFADESIEIPVVWAGGPTGSFDDGLPDSRLFPAQTFSRAYRTALARESKLDRLYYGDPRGHPRLREALANMLNADRGLSVGAENICITRGSQMAVFLASRVLIRPGDAVALDDLTYPPAFHAFLSAGASVVPIKTDASGFDVDHFESECRKSRIRSVYLTPHHHFPTTVMFPTERRFRLLSIAEQFRFSIVEDDYDHDYNFDTQPLLPMAGFSPEKVVYIGSFSKILSPHLRLGYVVASEETVNAVARQIVLLDRQGDQITELAVADFLESDELLRHARRALGIYRERRNAFANVLKSILENRAHFVRPQGGLAFWIEFDNANDLDLIEANARRANLRLLLSEQFRLSEHARRGLRLGFASKTEDEALAALKALFQPLSSSSLARVGIQRRGDVAQKAVD